MSRKKTNFYILKLRTWITKPFMKFIGFKFRNTNTFEMTPFITCLLSFFYMHFQIHHTLQNSYPILN
ncbi:hypothetical protein BpHYR1_006376 [Brachionus plicatilis]|uniref:Uncharacterized protein n=1 Tax=Brachionus plicatilis TaxID=10195 RepID=A0A3M7R6B5_BRAPC|nr:hypothetical protein BpHYR1_006376 [Brachionus plicatilis]